MTFTVEGMDDDEGGTLLKKLFDHIEQVSSFTRTTGAPAISCSGTIVAPCMRARIFPTRSADCCAATSSWATGFSKFFV